MVGDIHNRIHIKQAVYILAHNCQTLQTHTCIDIFLHQLSIVAVAVVIKLGEHIVPNFHITVAVTAHSTVRLAAAVLLATVVIDLGAGAAGAGAVLPEVICLSETEDLFSRNADLLVPDFKGFLIVFVDGRIQAVCLQTNYLGQELPAPGNGLALKIVTKGEVAQHLEICSVAGSLTDVLNITGADALLTGADTVTGRLHLALEIGLHRCHAGVDQQQGLVILRDQGKAGQTQMLLAFKEAQEHLTQLIYAICFGCH